MKKRIPEKGRYSDSDIVGLSTLCFHSQHDRKQLYDKYRSYYFTGAGLDDDEAIINRVYGDINNIQSMIWSPDNLILEGKFDSAYAPEPIDNVILETIKNKVSDRIKNGKLSLKMGTTILNSLIDQSAIIKVIWRKDKNEADFVYIRPENCGLLYEAKTLDDHEQVICIKTELTERQMRTKFPAYLKKIKTRTSSIENSSNRKAFTIIASQTTANTVTDLNGSNREQYAPRSGSSTYEVREIWFYEKSQWYKALVIDQDVVDLDDSRIINPFYIITPIPVANYIWGKSLLGLIVNVQDERNDFIEKLKDAINRKIKPSTIATGFNLNEEDVRKGAEELVLPNGMCIINGNGVTIKEYIPDLDMNHAFEYLSYLDNQERFVTGLNEIMTGNAAKNVRSSGYASMLAQFASSELKKMAHIIESQIEEICTAMGNLYQSNDDEPYRTGEHTYKLGQLSADYTIEFYGHSSSPITTEQNINLMMGLKKENIIPTDVLLDVLPVPFKDKIKKYVEQKAIEDKKMHEMQTQMMMQQQQQKQQAGKQGR